MLFDKDDFDKEFDDFDKKMASYRKRAIATWLFCASIELGVLGFVIWAIIMVMRYIGVI